MNRLIYLLIFFLFSTCKSASDIKVIFNDNNQKVIFLSAKNNKKIITRILLPNNISIINKSNSPIYFVKVSYLYNKNIPIERDYGFGLFMIKNNELYSISNTGRKKIGVKKEKNYSFYTKHFIDSTKIIQKEFKPYIEKMLAKNQDTLHIGTLAYFKQKHKELFERLTKKDSISIQLLDNDKLGERITVPVKWN